MHYEVIQYLNHTYAIIRMTKNQQGTFDVEKLTKVYIDKDQAVNRAQQYTQDWIVCNKLYNDMVDFRK